MADAMNPAPYYLRAGCPLQAALELLVLQGLRGVPVIGSDGRPQGVITSADVLAALAVGVAPRTVGELLDGHPPAACRAEDTLDEACQRLAGAGYRPLVVLDRDGGAAGLLAPVDVVAAIARAGARGRWESPVLSGC